MHVYRKRLTNPVLEEDGVRRGFRGRVRREPARRDRAIVTPEKGLGLVLVLDAPRPQSIRQINYPKSRCRPIIPIIRIIFFWWGGGRKRSETRREGRWRRGTKTVEKLGFNAVAQRILLGP